MPSTLATGRLQGRVAIITGSSGGLGRAIAQVFASEGARCFCVDKYANPRSPVNAKTGKADDWNSRMTSTVTDAAANDLLAPIDEASAPTHLLLQHKYGPQSAVFHAADLTVESQVIDLMEQCIKEFGRMDILINSHGISTESTHPKPLRCHDLPISDFLLTQTINTTSVFLTCKHFLATILKTNEDGQRQQQLYEGGLGWIVNISSVQGLIPYYATPGYCASKGAVVMLTKQIALDYAADGIRCNCVCPGFLNTNMTRNLQQDGLDGPLGAVIARQPLRVNEPTKGGFAGGLGNVEDVAKMVLVAASDDVRWMTGQPLVVDGGYMIS